MTDHPRRADRDWQAAVRDLDGAHPVPDAWRPMFSELVRQFSRGDFACRLEVPGVNPITASTSEQMREYVAAYGATLIELPEATWETSIAQWMGAHWEVLVDLWTAEEGRSDLVLQATVEEVRGDARITVHMLYVP